MNNLLIPSILAITLALVFYTIGVFAERHAKVLRKPHVVFFWLGLACDSTGTALMSRMAGESDAASSMTLLHGITGGVAIALMIFHAIWATVTLARNDEKGLRTFHRFSLFVWIIWLIPYVLGMVMGMKG